MSELLNTLRIVERFHVVPSPDSGVEGFLGDRWQEEDYYYEFPRSHSAKESTTRQGRAVGDTVT